MPDPVDQGKIKATIEKSGLFDADHWIGQTGDESVTQENALDHYVAFGNQLELDPHPLFNSRFYFLQCAELRTAREHPLYHYLTVGAPGLRSPHPLFDPLHYAQYFMERDSIPAHPFRHYLDHAIDHPDRDPHPLFSNAFYLGEVPELLTIRMSPLEHYVRTRGLVHDPNRYFDTGYYLQQIPEQPKNATPLEHYLRFGLYPPYLSPNPLLDGGYFIKHNPEVRRLRRNPLAHYLTSDHRGRRLVSNAVTKVVIDTLELDSGVRGERYRANRVIVMLFDADPPAERLAKLRQLRDDLTAESVELFLFAPARLLPFLSSDWPGKSWPLEKFVVSAGASAGLATLLNGLRTPFKPTIFVSDQADNLRPIDGCSPIHALDEYSGKAPVRQALGLAPSPGESDRQRLATGPAGRSRGRVLFPVINWSISGVNRWIESLSLELQRRGWEVELLLTGDPYRDHNAVDLPDVPLRHLDLPHSKPSMWWNSARDFLRSRAPAVVLTGYDFRFNSLASVCDPGIAFLGTLHSDDPDYYQQAERLGDYFDHIVTVSRKIRDEIVRKHPGWASKTTAIPYGIVCDPDCASCAPPDPGEPVRLIYTGRIVQEQKRVFDFVHLLDALEARGTPYHFTIAGDGDALPELMKRLDARAASGKVTFTGRIPMAAISREIARSHIFILTSEFEGLPLSLLEAIAHGAVPVVTDIESGIPEVIAHGESGFVVPRGDFAGFAETIADLHRNPGRWSRASSAAREVFLNRFTIDAMASAYEEVITALFDRMRAGITMATARTTPSASPDAGIARFGEVVLPPL